MIKLRPNCLLTRYPVCFLHGQKTLLSFFNYWNGVPRYLRAHGYETFELAAPWRGSGEVRTAYWLRQFSMLRERYDKIHVIAHNQATSEMRELVKSAAFDLEFIESLTLLDPEISAMAPGETTSKTTGPLIFELAGPWGKKPPHRLTKLAVGSKLSKSFRPPLFLDHCIFLAEHDLKTSQ